MQSTQRKCRTALFATLVIAFGSAVACSGPHAIGSKSKAAPEFRTISETQLQSAMWQLAAGVEELRGIFAERAPISREQRQQVIGILGQMIAAADELGPDGVSSNHARITENLTSFREKLEIALGAASRNPPSYYLVGHISGTCLACHGSR